MAAIRGAGLSFKLAGSTYVMTEVASWLNDLGASASGDELDGSTFTPGATQPVKVTLYGATTRGYALSGRWLPAVETFFSAIDGRTDVAYQHYPEGSAVGKVMIYGGANIGAWSGPVQEVNGVIGFSIPLSVNTRAVGTVIAPPATVAITSSSVADPTLITTTAAHGLATGQIVTIASHAGSTPNINGTHVVTVVSATTFTIPVNVTVGGTGGTIQKY